MPTPKPRSWPCRRQLRKSGCARSRIATAMSIARFTVPRANRDVYDSYVAGLKKENRPTDNVRFVNGFWCLIVSDDSEKTFSEAADHIIYQANNYSVWLSAAGLQPLAPHLNNREDL